MQNLKCPYVWSIMNPNKGTLFIDSSVEGNSQHLHSPVTHPAVCFEWYHVSLNCHTLALTCSLRAAVGRAVYSVWALSLGCSRASLNPPASLRVRSIQSPDRRCNATREQITPESRCTGFFLALPSRWVGASSFHAAPRFAFVLLGESIATKDESRWITRASGEQFVITNGTGGQPEWSAGCLDILICYVSRKGEFIMIL